VPSSGQQEIADQLDAVGLLDRVVRCEDLGAELPASAPDRDAATITSVVRALEAVAEQDQRTLVLAEFPTIGPYEQLLGELASLQPWICLIVMDTPLSAIAARQHAAGSSLGDAELEELYARLATIDLEKVGLPFVMSSSLSLAIEGQDDW
jgi:hypothetical protein